MSAYLAGPTFWAGPAELPATFPASIFWSRVQKTEGCWIWQGAITANGYGRYMFAKKSLFAHRIAWLLVNGSIDPALPIDHLCRTRGCVNPSHMQQVTERENTVRGRGPTAVNSRKVDCNQGHSLSGPNLYVNRGKRRCRTCLRADKAKYRARLRSRAALASPAPAPQGDAPVVPDLMHNLQRSLGLPERLAPAPQGEEGQR